jgi:aminopeptidase N
VYAKARQLVPFPRAWIQDGLAHFAQAEFIEKQKGRPAALEYLQSHATALIAAEKDTARMSVDQQSSHSLINAPDDLYLQSKAMYVWWMLRDTLGTLPVEALRDYHAAEDKEPSYLPTLISKQANRDLQWFFDDWVYHDRGLPDFRVASVFATPIATGGFLITVNVENLGNAGAEVPLTLEFEGGELRKRLEVRAKSTASIRFETPGTPQQVTVNDGSVPETDVSNNSYKIDVSKH